MTERFADPEYVMQRAIELAALGRGLVEPNPPVGAVLVDDELRLIAQGYHERFGGPHAEINVLQQAAGNATAGTLFVTLEPCCHHGKTGPCTVAIIQAGVRRVVVGMPDPSPHVAGAGIAELKAAGIAVEVGLLEQQVMRLTTPFLKFTSSGMPYVHAKWAMTLDGKIASRTGASRWISNPASREIVHRLRSRMDAIVVSAATALSDDPLLTARPPGPRVATRIVVDSQARLPVDSQLVRTLDRAPVMVVSASTAAEENIGQLQKAGVEVLQLGPAGEFAADGAEHSRRPDLISLFRELGRRQMTNVLVEGGSRLLGSLFDQSLIDEAHVFVAPKIVGGLQAITPISGIGLAEIPEWPQLDSPEIEIVDGDVYIHGPLLRQGGKIPPGL